MTIGFSCLILTAFALPTPAQSRTCLYLDPVFMRRDPFQLLEDTRELLGVLEANRFAYVRKLYGTVLKQFLGLRNPRFLRYTTKFSPYGP